MIVKVNISGPMGSGKTVIAEFLQRQLGTHGIQSTVTKGGDPKGPEFDTMRIETDIDSLRKLANSN